MRTVSNSGPIMSLAKLGLLNMLYKLYGQIYIPTAVYYESVVHGLDSGYLDAYHIKSEISKDHIKVINIDNIELPEIISSLSLDNGEKQSLYLAVRDKCNLILLDDLFAREEAKKLGLSVKGTIGVIIQSYRKGYISLDQVEEIVQKLSPEIIYGLVGNCVLKCLMS